MIRFLPLQNGTAQGELPVAAVRKEVLTWILGTVGFLAVVLATPAYLRCQAKALTLDDVNRALSSKLLRLPEKNQLLIEGVKTRGIDFVLTPDIEKQLRDKGASQELIVTIRQFQPKPP